jgi:hypothetical protein
LVGVAVNVTDVPEQIVWFGVAMLTDGVTDGFTVMVSEFEVAVAGEAQVAVEVTVQVTAWPLVSVVVV